VKKKSIVPQTIESKSRAALKIHGRILFRHRV